MKRSLLVVTVLSCLSLAWGDVPVSRDLKSEETNKTLVVSFYERFFNMHQIAAAEVISEDYKQHNPQVPDGKTPFLSYFGEFFKTHPGSRAKIIRTAAEGDLVYLHVHSTDSPSDRGQAVMDIFRVKDGKIVEHWDVIQDVPEEAQNRNTMF